MAYVHLIADYGDAGAFAEVQYAIHRAVPAGSPIIVTRVDPLNDLHTAFWVQQHGLVESPLPETILFVNTAPRAGNPNPCPDNNQEPLVYGRLQNGVHVLAMNAGHVLSWVSGFFPKLHEVVYDHGESQWRSRDGMPRALRALVTGELSARTHQLPRLGKRLDPLDTAVIPPVPKGIHVAHVDDYGNIKLSLRQSQVANWKFGTTVAVQVDGHPSQHCAFRRNTFDIAQGGWVVAPGSSGHQDRFLEVWLRRGPGIPHGAAGALGGVRPGDQVILEPLG
ncbi:MAG: hypothetical protein Q7S23_00200 [bacterium]|nr:hypothetical protein [bacterium]